MTQTGTVVQLSESARGGSLDASVANPFEISDGEPVERLSLDVRASDVAFLVRFAAYRNALARAQGKKIKRQWSRKSLMESLLSIQVDGLRQQLRGLFDALGEIPEHDTKDSGPMDAYAKRAAAWFDKQSKQSK